MNAFAKLNQNQTNGFHLSQEDKNWLSSCIFDRNYCHYFALNLNNNEFVPFFTLEELNQFTHTLEATRPHFVKRLKMGSIITEQVMRPSKCKYWTTWQQKHKERISYLEQQTKLKAQQQLERKEKLARWLNAVIGEDDYCHYFCVFRKGTEVYPFGLNQAPYYTFEEAEKVMLDYEFIYPQYDFYIGSGAIASDITFVGEYSNEAEKIWAEQHKARLQSLSKEPAA